MSDRYKIPFTRPIQCGAEYRYIQEAFEAGRLSGDRQFSKRCSDWLKAKTQSTCVLMTPSCTHALEMTALLLDIGPNDEVIMPSFTFTSTANAFVLRGAKIIFVDIRPDTMNLDEKQVEAAVTGRTRAIVPVHYAGVACEMDALIDIAQRHKLFIVEDAAQALMADYKGRPLGGIGHFGTISFHESKNYQCGEGGALLINDEQFVERAEIIREKGTNRSRFFRGEVDRYTWLDLGSSQLLNELSAAYLLAQLEQAEMVTRNRLERWNFYMEYLLPLQNRGCIELPWTPPQCNHNAHIFYIKTADMVEKDALLAWLKTEGILATFHYIPLHSSPAGRRFGEFRGEDRYTTRESGRILRLPLYCNMDTDDIKRVCDSLFRFYGRDNR